MEIKNNTASSRPLFLPNKQKSNAARTAILPLNPLKQEQRNSAIENAGSSLSKTESNKESLSSIQAPNITRAQQQAHSSRQTSTTSYKVIAHEQQLARHAEKAIASYNIIEHSQYGQELVNRIELLV
ncbi:hypothetical protein MNBD_GAMMA23-1853 [hydrothermal vent metagenome]|uniref:Uncharacterized protein n=1 Tax=hydrothermal vent metagenome TaxID=652676 RepID=A0A3B1AHZ9_9ZZZZ